MKIELIKFGVPGKLSRNIYSFDETEAPTEVDFKIIDIRNTNYLTHSISDLEEFIIGKCQLIKDEEGVWIVGYDSTIKITDELLSKSNNKYWMGGQGKQVDDGKNCNKIEGAKVVFVYLSVEEDIKEIVRDLKLSEIGI